MGLMFRKCLQLDYSVVVDANVNKCSWKTSKVERKQMMSTVIRLGTRLYIVEAKTSKHLYIYIHYTDTSF